MTAIILSILGIRLAALRPTLSQALVAATRWLAYRKQSIELLARIIRQMPSFRCFRSASESDDFLFSRDLHRTLIATGSQNGSPAKPANFAAFAGVHEER